MPFTSTQSRPNPNSRITISFAGLQLLRPRTRSDNVTICEVGVHKFSQIHKFQVLLIVKKPAQPPVVIRLLDGPLQRPFTINVLPDPLTGVRIFEADTAPFNRGNPNNDALDSRWKINMKGLQNHQRLEFNDGAQPIASLNAGVIYASNLSRPGLRPVLKKGINVIEELHYVADLGAEVPLPEGSRVTLAWHDHGKPQTLDLPRPNEDTTTYTVALINDPPVSSPAPHDELEEYYRVLMMDGQPINEGDRFSLIYETPQKSDEIPCLVVTLEP